jgi:hypothetical protein
MKVFFASLLLFLSSSSVFSQQYWTPRDSYICIPSQSTGFFYNKSEKKWKPTSFNVEGKKYLVKRVKDEGYRWSELGTDRVTFCENSMFTKKFGHVSCKLFDGSLELQLSSLKFIETYNHGYIDGSTENTLTPNMTIGTCAVLE